tara:strand:- start:17092 stop:17382 length:291 start_codon:yes stop_codon:yes gene_type:complete
MDEPHWPRQLPKKLRILMKIKIKGEMTLVQMRQALFEKLLELEERFAVRHLKDATLYIQPTNGFGDFVSPRYANGQKVTVLYGAGPYESAAEFYKV